MNQNRKSYLDFLKVLGLFGIIAAHVNSPKAIMMARSFDVPFMVFLSAMLAGDRLRGTEMTAKDACSYILKRLKRLVIPTWLFLVFFFLVKAAFGETNNVRYYIYSFMLTRYGIGYVWIVLIYLFCAILTPAACKMGYGKKTWLITVSAYVLYEIAFYFSLGTESRFIMSTVYYIIPYGMITIIGFYYDVMKKRQKVLLFLLSGITFLLMAIYYYVAIGEFQLVSIAKYPPRIYYLSYALAVSVALLMICEKRNSPLYALPIVQFLSRHSFWIYLWHVFYLWIFDRITYQMNWMLEFALVVFFSGCTVWLQNVILCTIEKTTKKSIPKYLKD